MRRVSCHDALCVRHLIMPHCTRQASDYDALSVRHLIMTHCATGIRSCLRVRTPVPPVCLSAQGEACLLSGGV